MNPWEQLAEERIQESLERGEQHELEGMGRPLDLDGYFNLPGSVRVGYGMLKSAGVLPPEVENVRLLDQINEKLANAEGEECQRLKQQKLECETLFQMALERMKRMRHTDV